MSHSKPFPLAHRSEHWMQVIDPKATVSRPLAPDGIPYQRKMRNDKVKDDRWFGQKGYARGAASS